MIPVRVRADFVPNVIRDDIILSSDHWLYGDQCPACYEGLGLDGKPIALVAVGIAPQNRKESGWTNGAAVALHADCARPRKSDDAS